MPTSRDEKSLSRVFAAAIDHSDALIFVTDHQGVIEYANPAFCETSAFEEKDILGLNVSEIAGNAENRILFSEICQTLSGNEPWRGDLIFESRTGNLVSCRSTVSPVPDEKGIPDRCVWMNLDITEQKALERSHNKNEKRLQGILDNIPAYVFSKNREGQYTYVNKLLSMLHAKSQEEIIGLTDFDLFPTGAASEFVKNDQLVFEKHRTVRALEDGGVDEYGIERSYLSVKCPLENEDGDVEEMLGMSVDISEQQRLEKALRNSEEKLNSILDNMKARVYIKDKDGKYTYANEELCRILGTDRINLLGKDDYDLFETETAVGFRATDDQVYKTAKKVSSLEVSVEPESGEKRYYWSVKVPLLDSHGTPHSLLGISTDITEQKRLEKALMRNERQLTTILDNIKAHVYIKDINYTYSYVNKDMCDYLDMSREDVIGKTDIDIFGQEYSDLFRKTDRQVLDLVENSTCIEESFDTKTQEKRFFWSVKVPLINDLGNPYAILGISSDVSEQKRLEEKLRKMASTDALTGINNRRYFLELFENEIQRARRYGNQLSLLMLDIDHFKQINDTYGHSVGDTAIREMTRICLDCMRNTDVIGRLGGEEFALLLPETDVTGAWQIAQRIRAQTESNRFSTGGEDLGKYTASLGLTTLNEADETPDDMLKRADIALYVAKETGRNRVCEK